MSAVDYIRISDWYSFGIPVGYPLPAPLPDCKMLHPNDRPIYHIETGRIPMPDLSPIPPCYLGGPGSLRLPCDVK
jgi:hypothetical protein